MDKASRRRAVGLAESVDRTLAHEAARNALRLAWVRVLVVATFVVMDAGFYLYPQQTLGSAQPASPANVALVSFWCAVSAAVLVALRAGRDSAILRGGVLVLDPVIVLTLFLTLHGSLGTSGNMMYPAITAAAFTLVGITGALHLSRSAAAASTALALAGFAVVASILEIRFTAALLVGSLIAGAGLIGMRLAENTRRAIAAEGDRVILRRFLPPGLAEGDPLSALQLVGTPRQAEASVLISDLRGFTSHAEKLPPGDALALLNDIQGALAACVHRHGGTVDKFMGDGMLAVFGVPVALPAHASAAVACALDMQECMAGQPLPVGVGVHSGTVVAGCVGSDERLEFTVIGDTVNTASRLQAATKDLRVGVLVSEAARDGSVAAGGPGASFADAGLLSLRGRSQPIRAFHPRRSR